jgi:hypothetical protein
MSQNRARENMLDILRGKKPATSVTVEAAKARLRAADPALDISRPLTSLNQGNLKQAGVALSIEIATTATFSYLRPLFSLSLTGLAELLAEKQRNKRCKLPENPFP